MPMFTKKTVKREAEQFVKGERLPFAELQACCFGPDGWYVTTTHGHPTPIAYGNWIIREPNGNGFYPCEDAIFRAEYDSDEQVFGGPEPEWPQYTGPNLA